MGMAVTEKYVPKDCSRRSFFGGVCIIDRSKLCKLSYVPNRGFSHPCEKYVPKNEEEPMHYTNGGMFHTPNS